MVRIAACATYEIGSPSTVMERLTWARHYSVDCVRIGILAKHGHISRTRNRGRAQADTTTGMM